jgi:hypothetical protein
MASSRALWVLGEDRLISSAKMMWWKIGAGFELKGVVAAVVDGHPQDVRGQEIRRELDALEGEPQGLGQGQGQGGLAHAGDVLDQEVAFGENAGQGLADDGVFAFDDGADAFFQLTGEWGHGLSLFLIYVPRIRPLGKADATGDGGVRRC